MKEKRKVPSSDLNRVIPILIEVWRRYHKLAGPPDKLQTREFRTVVASIQNLQEKMHKGEKEYFNNPQLLGDYLLYHWVLHYLQGISLIQELPQKPGTVLDIGAGLSPFGCAALRHGASEVIAFDENLNALKLGAEVIGRLGYPLSIRKGDALTSSFPKGTFDLIIIGHTLRELFPPIKKGWQEGRKQWIDYLLDALKPQGYLLLVEGSLPEENRYLLSLRDQLVEQGIKLQAPCIWQGRCPALETSNSPCYAQRELEKPDLIKEFQRAANINLSSLKMSYLLIKSKQASTLHPSHISSAFYRVISPPVPSFIGKRYYLCGFEGKKSLSSPFEEHSKEARAFDFLKRGDLIAIENASEKGAHLTVKKETVICLKAAKGKPFNFEREAEFHENRSQTKS